MARLAQGGAGGPGGGGTAYRTKDVTQGGSGHVPQNAPGGTGGGGAGGGVGEQSVTDFLLGRLGMPRGAREALRRGIFGQPVKPVVAELADVGWPNAPPSEEAAARASGIGLQPVPAGMRMGLNQPGILPGLNQIRLQPQPQAKLPDALPAGPETLFGKAAGAVGPLGMALAAAYGIEKLGQATNAAADGVARFGGAMSSAAQNDFSKFKSAVQETTTDLLKAIPVIGDMAAGGARFVQNIANLPDQLTKAFIERGRQIQEFSPELTGANVGAEIRTLMADIREAQVLGPGMAELTRAQSELDMAVREIWLPIKLAIINELIPLVRGAAEIFKGMKIAAEETGRAAELTKALIAGTSEGVTDILMHMREEAAKRDSERGAGTEDFEKQLWGDIERAFRGGGRAFDVKERPVDDVEGSLALPIFARRKP